jgi:hypothetical protein
VQNALSPDRDSIVNSQMKSAPVEPRMALSRVPLRPLLAMVAPHKIPDIPRSVIGIHLNAGTAGYAYRFEIRVAGLSWEERTWH